ncbi:hypothetical protein GE061_013781 [Apolygus lucorum]|uniref:Down syndrome cell adhesion molecule n=1 Tax=Apolygus lucorum TaxID=248454 RepID=A0A8S9XPV6_APOLU|nr:hypothetical protein GE061_013781 [Apolygus lucorum]
MRVRSLEQNAMCIESSLLEFPRGGHGLLARWCDDTTVGPMFIKEPPNRVDFSNTTGSVIECTARGNPTPEIIWIRSDGTAVGDVPGLRQVLGNGNLVFPPFRAEDYRQEVHAQVYICLARNSVGSIHSRDVNVRAVVAQAFDVDVNKDYAIRGNSVILKCSVPSFVADFLTVVSWHTDAGEDFYPNNNYVVAQDYETSVGIGYAIKGNSIVVKCEIPSFVADFVTVITWLTDADEEFIPSRDYVVAQDYETGVGNVFAIRGNSIVIKCEIPSFVADFVTVASWLTDADEEFVPNRDYVVQQQYETEVNNEFVIRGNSAILKCNIPSFVADFVSVVSWEDGETMVNQFYEAEVVSEYVIRGNAAVMKCNIPSFVADFVQVDAWVATDGTLFTTKSTTYVVNQLYETGILNEFVIRGNAAILKCSIPSYVADFVYVEAWVDDFDNVYTTNDGKRGNYVVSQEYNTEAENEYVIRGNSAVMKCKIPSFVADFVRVVSWLSNEGVEYFEGPHRDFVVSQDYFNEAENEHVIRGNSGLLKCKIPSFVADYVQVVSWLSNTGEEYYLRPNDPIVVSQHYEAEVLNKYVIRGNAVVMKCEIPSFVADFVSVVGWVDSAGSDYLINEKYVVIQPYESEADNEYVIRGNSVVMKCEIPSFVTDFVSVVNWIDSLGNTYSRHDKYVVMQDYKTRVMDEDVLRGNSAILKCILPSFVADFIQIVGWLADDGQEFVMPSPGRKGEVVMQDYKTRVVDEDVLRGNSAILKCLLPSFIADFVQVVGWVADDGTEILSSSPNTNLNVVGQFYETRVMDEFVLRGNSAVVKCLLPSFVADFVRVVGWVDSEGADYVIDHRASSVVDQFYESRVNDEFVLRGNAAVVKCLLPSFVADFVQVIGWVDGDDDEYGFNQRPVVDQEYDTRVIDEYVLRGNSAILKCLVPSFVSDFIQVIEWTSSDDQSYTITNFQRVVNQVYEVQVYDVFVIKGNTAVFKCNLPSYVSDHVEITSWTDTQGNSFIPNEKYVVSQSYDVNVMDEHVLRGNAAVFKCHIPSFVADFVVVASWLQNGDEEIMPNRNYDGKYLVLPSGELHIKDVGPEDGQKSYQCRTKHRLTGETRLSATKGRLVITEPVGTSGPQFSSSSIFSGFIHKAKTAFSLQCPAQAFPVPRFSAPLKHIQYLVSEPVGGTRPKISGVVTSMGYTVTKAVGLSLQCPGQAYPVPEFRKETVPYVCIFETAEPVGTRAPTFSTDLRWFWVKKARLSSFTLPCQAQGYPVPNFRDCVNPSSSLEPLGSKGPTVPAKDRFNGINGLKGSVVTSLCEAQGYPIPSFRYLLSNPLGSKAPTVPAKDLLSAIKGLKGSVITGLCEAQGYPIPSFSQDSPGILCRIVVFPLIRTCEWFIKIPDPVGTKSPKFTLSFKLTSIEVVQSLEYSLLCQAQGYPVPSFKFSTNLDEPLGSKAPNVGDDMKLRMMVKQETVTAALFCSAQGYPIPTFRWYKFVEGTAKKQPVVLSDRIKQVSGTLIIREAKVEDSGKYLCVVNNSVGGESVETVLTVTAPLVAGVEPTVQTVDFGRPALLTCNYEGNPVKTVSWLKDGKALPGQNNAMMKIDSVKKEDKGMYQCFVRNEQESAQASAELKLGSRFEPPLISQGFPSETLQPGPSVYLKCVAKGNPTPEITWFLDGKKLASAERIQVGQYVTVSGDVISHMNITAAQTNDGGLYKCVASSKVGTVEHAERLNIHGLPYVRPMEKKAIVAGETLFVTCPVAGYPIDTIQWERDGRLLPINRKQKVFPNGTLIIENVERLSDQATYTCVAKNTKGYSSRGTLEVQVMVIPHINPFYVDDEIYNGDSVQLNCHVSKGDKPLVITWSFHGEELSSHMGIETTKLGDRSSVLSITSAMAAHTGNYTCTASNRAGSTSYTTALHVNVKPFITPFSFEENNFAGGAVQVNCFVSQGDAPLKIHWNFHGETLSSHLGMSTSRIGERTSLLTIDSLMAAHSGSYTCNAENAAGSTSYTTSLIVSVKPFITPFDFEANNFAGGAAQVTCFVSKGDAPLKISWSFHGEDLSSHMGMSTSKLGERMSILVIDSMMAAHSGNYTCTAENAAGSTSYTTNLIVSVKPFITPFFFEENNYAGGAVQVNCFVSKGDLPIKISWSFHGEDLSSHMGMSTSRMGERTSFLTIDSLMAAHSGNYTCTAENPAGSSSYTVNLLVSVLPHIVPFELEEDVNNGDSAQLSCHVSKGDLPLSISWSFHGEDLSSHLGITTTKVGGRTSLLIIPSAMAAHSGNYTCSASNSAGSSNFTTSVRVNVLPHIVPFAVEEEVNNGDNVQLMCHVSKGDIPLSIAWSFHGEELSSHLVMPKVSPFSFGEDPYQENQFVTVACSIVMGDFPITITWMFNNHSLISGEDITVVQTSKRMSLLTIESVKGHHAGTYSCIGHNEAGYDVHSANLLVNVAPKISPFSFGDEPLEANEFVSVTCSIMKGDFPIKIDWLFNNQTLTVKGDITISQSDKLAPKMSPFSFGEEPLEANEYVTVICSVMKGDFPIKIIWMFNNQTLTAGGDVSITQNGKRASNLAIESIKGHHAGTYSCVGQNEAGYDIHSAELLVNVTPKMSPFSFGDEPLEANEFVTVTCSVMKGDFPLTIHWLFNNQTLTADEDISITQTGKRTSNLAIESIKGHHAGTYSCIGQNDAGHDVHSAELLVNEEPLQANEFVNIMCSALKGDLPITISWLFNNQSLMPNDEISVSLSGKRTSTLAIESVKGHHAGIYSCIARNEAGYDIHSADLLVNVAPKISPFSFGDEPLQANEYVSVMCTVMKGDLPIKISWMFNDQTLVANEEMSVSQSGRRASNLVIESVKGHHAGTYSCIGRNDAGFDMHSTNLLVNVAPKLSPFSFGDEPYQANQFVTVTCSVVMGDFPISLQWKFNNQTFEVNEDVSVTQTGKRMSVLAIESVKGEHAGTYSCIGKNEAGFDVHSSTLVVNVAPKMSPFSFGDDPLEANEFVTVTCSVLKGDLPITISWMFNNESLVSNEEIIISKTGQKMSVLVIDSVKGHHAGTYSCIGRNDAGTDIHSADLLVNVLPKIMPFSFGEDPVFAGQSVQVTCFVNEGDLPLDIKWEFSGSNDFDELGIMTSAMGKKSSYLSIDSIDSRHSGTYILPKIMPFSFGDDPVFAGQSVQVTCIVNEGDLPLDIKWEFSGNRDFDDLGIMTSAMGKKASFMSIDSIDSRHSGTYSCTAKNRAGKVQLSSDLNVNVLPKIMPFSFGDDPVFAGQSLQAACFVIEGDLPLDITWEFSGSKGFDELGIATSAMGKKASYLSIDSIDSWHSGTYTCTAQNKAGKVQLSSDLNVNVLPKIMPFSFGDDPVFAGQSLQAACFVIEGDHPLQIMWEFNGTRSFDDLGVITSNVGKKTSLLNIESVDSEHAGTYSCVAKNRAGEVRVSSSLNINVAPRIVPFSFGGEPIFIGQSVQLSCFVVEGDLPLLIEWDLDGNLALEHMGIEISRIGRKGSILSIDSLRSYHSGTYTCSAANDAGSVQWSSDLLINVPPRWIIEPTDKAFAQGSDAKVECKADGFPKPSVTWKRASGDSPGDYKDLKPNNPDVKVEDGTLHVHNIQKVNEGYYLCEAVNGIGSGLSAVIMISVQAPPQFEVKMRNQTARINDPTVLQCEAKGEKPIGILWNMNNKRLDPKNDARYTIREETTLPNGVLSDLSIKSTGREDSALFTCVATNSFGSDDSSINLIVQEVPEAPQALKVLDKSGRSVQLSWVAPYDGNSPIIRYLIEYKVGKGSWDSDVVREMVPGHQTMASVFNLSPATTYHMRVVAENEVGISQHSEPVTIVTAEEAPSGPPMAVKVEAIDQVTLKVTWKPPERDAWNGEIQGYYVGYKLTASDKPYLFETVEFSKEEGREHHLLISNLKTYTQYSVVVQAFNKLGAGPMSEEKKQYTAEGIPEQPPHDPGCTTLTSETIRVSWTPPPAVSANGVIKGYKVIYGPSETWYDEKSKDSKITASSETIIHGLRKFTNYSMQVLAYTAGGDGVRSSPIHCQTEQDVPDSPTAVKALAMSDESILISWKPPANPNGLIIQYTVYIKEEGDNGESPRSQKMPPSQMTYEASGLKNDGKYEFWVTASTNIGEGQPSKPVVLSPNSQVPARIASFDSHFTATYREDVKLPCLAVGKPTPDIKWKIKGTSFEANDRMQQLPEGSLLIKSVNRADAGEYSCSVENSFGRDTVTHHLIILAPPHVPQITMMSTTTNSITMKLKPNPADTEPIHGYTVKYKPEFGDWETLQLSPTVHKYTLENLWCGSRYMISVVAYNSIGTGDESDLLNTRTKGSKPIIPEASRFIEVSTNSITLHLSTWSDGGCPMLYFVVEHKKKMAVEWNQVSNNVKPGGNFVVLDLDPATWYNLRVTAHNNAGFAVAEYEFATLTITGGTIAPAREVPDSGFGDDSPMKILLANLNLVVPVVSALLVIIVAIIVLCFLRGKGAPHKDEMVYNQSMVGGNTIDKRCLAGGDLHDELGYIPPPNRKLPPVPGSNYNTCERIKRGTGIRRAGLCGGGHSTWDPRRHMYEELASHTPCRGRLPRCPGSDETMYHRAGMDDDICPYATFHLLGFREEMDPSKAMQFQTFPHQNGHCGTLGPGGTIAGTMHHRSGSQSMPRNGRYSRVGPNSTFSPEYDDPANCTEDDPYGSQYTPYGAPYDHYSSRNSLGRRSVGSPEPPPPPPRNHDSSANDSKESNEMSEAECDRDLINKNYPVSTRNNSKDGMTTEEMRKLIERNEGGHQQLQNGGLTAYDTVAV